MKITRLDNHRYNIPEDTAFMINELDEKQAEIDRLTLALRDSEAQRAALIKDLNEASGHIETAADEIERLRAALGQIAQYEIEENCPCHCCMHSAIARAVLETPTARAAEDTP